MVIGILYYELLGLQGFRDLSEVPKGLLYMGLGFKEFGVSVCVYEHQNIQGAFLGF